MKYGGVKYNLVTLIIGAVCVSLLLVGGCSSDENPAPKAAKVVRKVVHKKTVPVKVSPQEKKAQPGEEYRGYTASKLRDPFIPFLKTQEGGNKRKAALTPLEKFALGELRVVGILKKGKRFIALVEDNVGKGYTVKRGMKIGKNGGVVTKIGKDSISIVEEFEDISGKKVRKEKRLALPDSGGE